LSKNNEGSFLKALAWYRTRELIEKKKNENAGERGNEKVKQRG
jgi:hypothetical protein